MTIAKGDWMFQVGLASLDPPYGCEALCAIRSLPFQLPSVALEQQLQALSACDRGSIIRGDPLHFGTMSGFPVAGIAHHHPILVKGMLVAFPPSVPGHWLHPGRDRATSELTVVWLRLGHRGELGFLRRMVRQTSAAHEARGRDGPTRVRSRSTRG
jgi:hypothetical protein